MDSDDCKTWMLKRGECEELHCHHLFIAAATQEEPVLGMPIGAWVIVMIAVRDHKGGHNGTDHHHS